MADGTALVVENDPTDDVRRLGPWLRAGGLDLAVVRPHAGEDLPATLDGYAALVVLGGEQDAFPAADGTPGAPWFPALESLLRKAVRYRVATLAICLGGQLLATAHGGTVARAAAGTQVGPLLVGRRDAAAWDPLWAGLPLLPDVLAWHRDEITELPAAAVRLAASPRCVNQAYRLGARAWGVQFHIECDTAMIGEWVAGSAPELAGLGYEPAGLVAACDAVMDDLAEIWAPFAGRFARTALSGQDAAGPDSTGPDAAGPDAPGTPRMLPLLGQ